MPKWEVHQADCVEAMRSMVGESVDAIVTDPPYLIGFMSKEFDQQGGAHLDPASMGRWHLLWATEAFRVLKPGGHLLAFGGTRTYHRLACAVEDAGFEIRDKVEWVYSTGFPKSLNVAGAIDKANGEEGEVIGPNPAERPGNGQAATTSTGWAKPNRPPVRAPASDDARQWAGWGTALKPAHEPIVVARKPIAGTVEENVRRFGTGALNIDDTRVASADPNPSPARRAGAVLDYNSPANLFRGERGGRSVEAWRLQRPGELLGRWPPNLLFSHDQGCRRAGTRMVPKAVREFEYTGPLPTGVYGGGAGTGGSGMKAGEDVDEEIAAWSCAPTCPVAALDRQSGDCPVSGSAKNGRPATRGDYHLTSVVFGPSRLGKDQGTLHNDEGTASRFFPQFAWDHELVEESSFRYEPKASRSEREAGCEGLPAKDVPRAVAADEPALSATSADYRERWVTNAVRNHHPTVKPIALLRWLARLVTPPGGLLLDPFAGSGSQGCAAVLEGFNYIGIEKDADYCAIANARIAHWASPRPVNDDTPGGRARGRERTLDSFGEATP